MIERAEADKTKLRLEFPPIPKPRKITEGDIGIAVKDVIRKAQEQRDGVSASALVQSADAVVTDRLKETLPEKARHALRLSAQKAVLAASGLYLLLSSGCGNIEMPFSGSSHKAEPIPPSVPLKQQENAARQLMAGNVRVEVDREGLPVEYILSDGKRVSFDREEVKKLREKAILSQEPEIITMLPVEGANSKSSESQYKPSPEHPKVTELPEDVLSEEELGKRGVKIIQADNTSLFIRDGAFVEGSPLADFNNTGRKLTIVLLNNNSAVVDDPKYRESIEAIIPYKVLTLENYRAYQIFTREKILGWEREDIKEGKKRALLNNEIFPNHDDDLLGLKIYLYRYQNMTEGELFLDQLDLGWNAGGVYLKGVNLNPTILISVGKTYIPDLFLYFDSSGKIKAASFSSLPKVSGYFDPPTTTSINHNPKAEETHPDPKDFPINPKVTPNQASSYPYGSYGTTRQKPGFILRHEISHDKGGMKIREEYDTDMKAMEGIKSAWEKWANSGFTDNSGFYFVFSLQEGGYMLTKNNSSFGSSSPDKL